MPVQHGNIIILAGPRMPAKEMIVVRTYFPYTIMVPDIVIIDLRQGDAQQARDQEKNPQNPSQGTPGWPAQNHAWTPIDKRRSNELRPCYYG